MSQTSGGGPPPNNPPPNPSPYIPTVGTDGRLYVSVVDPLGGNGVNFTGISNTNEIVGYDGAGAFVYNGVSFTTLPSSPWGAFSTPVVNEALAEIFLESFKRDQTLETILRPSWHAAFLGISSTDIPAVILRAPLNRADSDGSWNMVVRDPRFRRGQ